MTYSSDAIGAVEAMVEKFGFKDGELTGNVVDYRIGLLTEEYQETIGAYRTGNAQEVVDGHIDMIVIALGNLSMFGVDAREAFDEVMNANMAKERGKRRESDPDSVSIVKPDGWVGPNHGGNTGKLDELFED
jgi:hypothetical protein